MTKLFTRIDSIRKVPSDGNCQFRAMSNALHGTDIYHSDVRNCVVNELGTNWVKYKPFVSDPDTYIAKMSRSGTFGDNVTLKAFSNAYNHGVAVIDKSGSILLIRHGDDPRDYITLVYDPFKQHYNSVYPYNVHPTPALFKRAGSHDTIQVQINRV